ncbi:TPA: DUF554 domain-containing protein [Klebsiella pneumoniae]|uniref:DUF554 domain-containing protein n=1 Tax=Klebsiella pneumoniae complex TaxID=3390273 RepID=UPI00142846BF|nr:DUF554 domain-containing protein [Klebsiella variicola]HCB0891996.1 DUF554 domain-containing protein [Klebsiella pneumoniae]QIS52411.1 DUF554 domain-containing protein [Klebsiella variicola]HCF8207026.1 DUF554 domain-containing protein [Klebsiella pneumoniae]HCF8514700.1 DUF554 domain-containing protein [Klebsiella pneumoniae]HCF8698312.1 DUF554 domain-containing protein [Klebsiella pneumoniae]
MIIGPYINSIAIIVGAITGNFLSHWIPRRLNEGMPLMFGICSMAMSVILIMETVNMPVMVLSGILGSLTGELISLEKKINKIATKAKKSIESALPRPRDEITNEEFLNIFVALIILFGASGTGIVGAMNEGMNGNNSVLVTKSFMDFFCAALFATRLGYSVATLFVPQLIIQLILAYGAVLLLPLTTTVMRNDFYAVGGLVMMATGLRICGIKMFPVANMLPALLWAMPLSWFWTLFFK